VLSGAARRCHTDRVKVSKLIGVAAVLSLAVGLSACAQSSTPVIAPVTMSAGDLEGEIVELVVGQVLNINTGDLAVDSYSGKVADTGVAEFVKGYEEGGATFNPGVKALAEGTTEVVLSNSDGGIEDVTFTVEVGK
jgi:hypothetical protein